ncbi:alanine racemase [Alkalicoccus daliensis]|uniref:Alanine racemase n=1 Tax=Alkalicoccus daliensis TaxID=745820 RepID=A0A1H0FRL9_9BACI|nr:alanine racemase [Alkalicoccus daliensis]SDN97182.1 alanine racemase [Alkalicoccus daliensis]
MKTSSYRPTAAAISTAAIEYNTRAFRDYISPDSTLMAVVKANGYGHGAVPAAKAAIRGGATALGVAIMDEALELRNAGFTEPLLVMGYTGGEEAIRQAAAHHITLTVFSEDVQEEMLRLAPDFKEPLKIHLKVDTGMGRIGVITEEKLLKLAAPLWKEPNIYVEGIFTHFAVADQADSPYTDEQFARFQEMYQALEDAGMPAAVKHCCNSAGTMLHPDKHLDMVRVGISLYGCRPDLEMELPFPIKPAMELSTEIVSLRPLTAGSTISYGRTHTLAADRLVATLPIGYADGLPRLISNRFDADVNGAAAPVIGRVCMDQTMIDVTEIEAGLHDKVTFSIDKIADVIGTINYEIVCGISPRVPRLYDRE